MADRNELLQRRKELLLKKRQMLMAQSASGGIVSEPILPEQQEEYKGAEESHVKNEWLRREIEAGRIVPEPTTFGQRFVRELPEMGGAAGGAALGGKLGMKYGPLGAFAGSVVGAVLGGMSGKGYEQTYRMGKGKPMTISEIYKEQGKAGLRQGVGEIVGQGTGKVLGKVAAPLKNKLIPKAPRLGQKLFQAGERLTPEEMADLTPYAQRLLAKKGAFLTAAQATESRGMDFVESATESSIFGGNRIFQLKNVLQPKAYQKVVSELSDEFWNQAGKRLSPEEVGQLFVDTVTGNREVQRRLERIAYGQVDEFTKGLMVNLKPVKAEAERFLAQAAKSKGLGSSSAISRMSKRVANLPDTVNSFMDAHAIRSNILEEARKLEGILNAKMPKVNRAAEIFASLMDDTMAKAAKAQSPEAYTAWRAANKLVRQGRERFDNEVVKSAIKLAQKRPELVAKSIFVPHGAQRLSQIKDVISPESYKTLLATYLDETIEASSSADGILLGKRFKKAINMLGADMKIQMFDSPEHLRNVMDVADLGEILQSPTGGAGMLMQLTQASGIVDLAVGLPTGKAPRKGSGLILVGPALMGRLLSTKGGAKWLSEGIKSPAGAKYVPQNVIRLLMGAYNAQHPQYTKPNYYRGYGGKGA